MISMNILFTAFIIAAVTAVPFDNCRIAVGVKTLGGARTSSKTMKLVAEYPKNHLQDISDDGRLLLFYQTSTPIRTYTIPLDGRQGQANQLQFGDDVLRVVERENGREIGRISTNAFPYRVQFVPGTQQVLYSEQKEYAKPGILEKLWNPTSGQVQICLDSQLDLGSKQTFLNITAISPHKAIAALAHDESATGERVAGLTLPDCKRTIIQSVNPSDQRDRFGGVFGA